MKVSVIGSGMAGTAAADVLHRAGVPVEIFEAQSHWGGHTHSSEHEGFVFDEGPHVSFTKDAKVAELFTRGAVDVEEFKARITNAFRGKWLTHPAQCHLYGLDPDLVTQCLVDFVQAQAAPPTLKTYADWCVAMFGDTFARTFPFAYTRKYWTVEAAEMSTDWVGQRMYPPKLAEVVRGALTPEQKGDFHYLSSFRYPSHGGYQSFMRGMHHPELLRLNKRVVELDVEERALRFADGTSAAYDKLISTMPITELVRAVRQGQAPSEVSRAAEALLCTSVVLIDIGVARPDLSEHHWFYVYDEDISFARGHYPHMLSRHNAPEGTGSIQLEVYFSRHKALPCSPESLPDRAVDELIRLGILRNRGEVLFARQRTIKYANVVFDHQRSAALGVILPWVRAQGIHLAGRYAEWAYHWTDDATKAGWAAADAVLSEAKTSPQSRA